MKAYFLLQFKLLNRQIVHFGLPLIIAYTIVPLLFYFGFNYVYESLKYSVFVLVILAISLVFKLSEVQRNTFLKSIYSYNTYVKIRLIENILSNLLLSIGLIYKYEILACVLLNVFSCSLVFVKLKTKFQFVISTPFYKHPFEFIVGFRNTFFMYPIVYLLVYISITSGNFNIGLFAILLICVICCSYYSKVENKYIVWNYSQTPSQFLKHKINIALLFFTLLCLPIIIFLSIWFFVNFDVLLIFMSACCFFLAAVVLAKYSLFPNDFGISQVILLTISVGFPPFLIILIPHFYLKSVKQLKSILND